jgi:pimeloyl-ACP methyl ester carboxylesterase
MRARGLFIALLAALLGGVLATPPQTYADSTGDGFYEPPDPLPPGQPGDVIRSRPVVAPAFPGAAGVWHILYRSSDINGMPIAVSGTVLVPRASTAGVRPVVVVTPSTRGTPDKCAPSKQYQGSSASPEGPDYEVPIVTQLLARGIVVAVTDYQGQGTPGLTSYLVGRPEGYAGLDAARAAGRLPGTGLTKGGPVGIAGYSQGGQAAGWAAQLQPEYAPELNLVGVALGGVPADMNVEVDFLFANTGAFFALGAISGLDFAYPELALDEKYLTARGVEVMHEIREVDCWEALKKWDGVSTSELTRPDVLTVPAWRQRFATSRLGTRPLPAPAYLYHGTADDLVPLSQFELLRGAWCGQSQAVELQEFPGMNHVQALQAGTVPAVQWLADRFAGRPAPDTC